MIELLVGGLPDVRSKTEKWLYLLTVSPLPQATHPGPEVEGCFPKTTGVEK